MKAVNSPVTMSHWLHVRRPPKEGGSVLVGVKCHEPINEQRLKTMCGFTDMSLYNQARRY